jgi:hypothetical protein
MAEKCIVNVFVQHNSQSLFASLALTSLSIMKETAAILVSDHKVSCIIAKVAIIDAIMQCQRQAAVSSGNKLGS